MPWPTLVCHSSNIGIVRNDPDDGAATERSNTVAQSKSRSLLALQSFIRCVFVSLHRHAFCCCTQMHTDIWWKDGDGMICHLCNQLTSYGLKMMQLSLHRLRLWVHGDALDMHWRCIGGYPARYLGGYLRCTQRLWLPKLGPRMGHGFTVGGNIQDPKMTLIPHTQTVPEADTADGWPVYKEPVVILLVHHPPTSTIPCSLLTVPFRSHLD